LVGAGVMPREDHIMDFSSPRAANETETFFDLIPHPRDTFEKAKAAAEHTAELVQAACTTTYDSAAALNVELIEAGRSNLNATLEFTREAIAPKSPAELPALMRMRASNLNAGSSKRGSSRTSLKKSRTVSYAMAQAKPSGRPLDAVAR
jgi:hypothetical protein